MISIQKPQRLQDPFRKPRIYASYKDWLITVAEEHGYALMIHGSLATDMDVVAVPWVDGASNPETLIQEIANMVCEKPEGKDFDIGEPDIRPHGRMSWFLLFEGSGV